MLLKGALRLKFWRKPQTLNFFNRAYCGTHKKVGLFTLLRRTTFGFPKVRGRKLLTAFSQSCIKNGHLRYTRRLRRHRHCGSVPIPCVAYVRMSKACPTVITCSIS